MLGKEQCLLKLGGPTRAEGWSCSDQWDAGHSEGFGHILRALGVTEGVHLGGHSQIYMWNYTSSALYGMPEWGHQEAPVTGPQHPRASPMPPARAYLSVLSSGMDLG